MRQLQSGHSNLSLRRVTSRLIMAMAIAAFFSTAPRAQSSSGLPRVVTFDSGDPYTGFDGFSDATGVTVPSQGCFAGRCLRSPLVEGTISGNYGDIYFGDHVGEGGSKVEEIWVRLWSKFDSGLTWPNRSQKIALLNLTDGVSSERRYQMMLDVSPQGHYFIERSDIAAWQFNGYGQNIGSPVLARLDQWDKLKMYVRLNTPNQSDGIARLWINGVLKMEYTNLNIRSGSSFGINKFILGTLATQQSPSAGVQWHDEVSVSTTDPDGQSTPSPGAPTNLRIVS